MEGNNNHNNQDNNDQDNNDQDNNDQDNNNKQETNDDYFRSLPVGYQFNPTDQELVRNYLQPMSQNEAVPRNRVVVKDIYQTDPETLTQYTKIREDGWYFFCPRDRKYPKGDRPRRDAGNGYWRATGKRTSIIDENNREIGKKQVLDFRISQDDIKTDWKMVEYTLPNEGEKDNPKSKIRNALADRMKLDHALYKIYINRRAEGNTKNGAIIIRENSDPMITAPVASHTDTTLVPTNEVGQAQPHASSTVYNNSLQPNYNDQSTTTSNHVNNDPSTSYGTNYGTYFGDYMHYWEFGSNKQLHDEPDIYTLLSDPIAPSLPSSSSTTYPSYGGYPLSENYAHSQPAFNHDMPPVDDSRLALVPSSHDTDMSNSMCLNVTVENERMPYVGQGDDEFERIEEFVNFPVDVHENDTKTGGEDHTKTD